jgi:D-threo-aldose 1-dehydrogenase
VTFPLRSRLVGKTDLRVTEIGFGAAPLGNLYRPLNDKEAASAIDAALRAGITYVDTAPYYGFGLSERRVGDALRNLTDIVISTKVGRMLVPDPTVFDDGLRYGFRSALPFRPIYDYSHAGVMRSWESSLQRLGMARVDMLLVHDIGRLTHGNGHDETFRALTDGGGFRALEELRAGGAIRAFGLGVNETAICLDVMRETSLDLILLAGRYTLIEQASLDSLLPECTRAGISIVVGGPYNSGILATGTRAAGTVNYDYGTAPKSVTDHVRQIEVCCDRHGVALPAAALQFPLAHPQVVSVIPGLGNPRHVEDTMAHYHARIPHEFWMELKAEHLLREDAPVPAEGNRF